MMANRGGSFSQPNASVEGEMTVIFSHFLGVSSDYLEKMIHLLLGVL